LAHVAFRHIQTHIDLGFELGGILRRVSVVRRVTSPSCSATNPIASFAGFWRIAGEKLGRAVDDEIRTPKNFPISPARQFLCLRLEPVE
jgi:hypothetical protein